jgi:hypothetical protein
MAELGNDTRQLLALIALNHTRGDPALLTRDVIELAQKNGLPDTPDPVENHAAGVDPFPQPAQRPRLEAS